MMVMQLSILAVIPYAGFHLGFLSRGGGGAKTGNTISSVFPSAKNDIVLIILGGLGVCSPRKISTSETVSGGF